MTVPRLRVRPAVRSDLSEVVSIEAVSFSDPWSEESFRTSLELDRVRFLVAEDEGSSWGSAARLHGYVIALLMGDEGEIVDLAVRPSERCRGVGGRLLDQVTAAAGDEGVRSLFLEVRESNLAARALYASRKFTPVGRRRGYYRDPAEDAVLMRRDFVTS